MVIKEAITNTGVHSDKSEESLSAGDASFNINIPQLVSYFKREEGIIIKKLPDGLLNNEQLQIKEVNFDFTASAELDGTLKILFRILHC